MRKQLTVFIENKKGSLKELTRVLKDANVNIFSFSLADTENFGLLRMVVDDDEKAVAALKAENISASLTDVTIVELKNIPGSLNELFEILGEVDIEYVYMYSNREDVAGIVLKLSDKDLGEKILLENNYKLL